MTFYELYEQMRERLPVRVDFRTKAGRQFKRELQLAALHLNAAQRDYARIAIGEPDKPVTP